MEEYRNQIFKRKRPERYLQFDRQIINNQNLSLKAKGMMSILLDQKDGWKFYESELVGRSRDGRTSVASALKELEENRYLIRIWLRQKGKYCGRIWVVYEEPLSEAEYKAEQIELESMAKKAQSNSNSTDFRFSDIGESEIGKSEIGKPAANDNNNNDNNINDNNNNDTPSGGDPQKSCCCDGMTNIIKEDDTCLSQGNGTSGSVISQKKIKIIMRDYDLSISHKTLAVLSLYSETELHKIGSTLQKKQSDGKIKNPSGLLASNPAEICESIISDPDQFYPSHLHNNERQKQWKSEGELYVSQEEIEALKSQQLS